MRVIATAFAGIALAASGHAAAAVNTVFAGGFESNWVAGYHVGYQKGNGLQIIHGSHPWLY